MAWEFIYVVKRKEEFEKLEQLAAKFEKHYNITSGGNILVSQGFVVNSGSKQVVNMEPAYGEIERVDAKNGRTLEGKLLYVYTPIFDFKLGKYTIRD